MSIFDHQLGPLVVTRKKGKRKTKNVFDLPQESNRKMNIFDHHIKQIRDNLEATQPPQQRDVALIYLYKLEGAIKACDLRGFPDLEGEPPENYVADSVKSMVASWGIVHFFKMVDENLPSCEIVADSSGQTFLKVGRVTYEGPKLELPESFDVFGREMKSRGFVWKDQQTPMVNLYAFVPPEPKSSIVM